MKNKKFISIILLLAGVLVLLIGLGMMQNAENRWIPGSMILLSCLIIGVTSKMIANDIILKNYLEFKKQINSKVNKHRENEVKRKASSRANMIVSFLLVVALVIIFFVGMNYTALALVIIISIFMQSSLNALLYIYYDKKIKEEEVKK